jgi:hypothetical protein
MKTVEEFLQNHLQISHFYDDKTNQMVCYSDEVQQAMVEFAKLHCEAQLKAILENVKVREDELNPSNTEEIKDTFISVEFEADKGYEDYCPYRYTVDKDSIINAYDLNQIK